MKKNDISPTGWYVASYLIRFIELENESNDELDNRFTAWENTVLVKAGNVNEAYDKVVKIASEYTVPYKGGSQGVPVRWVFEGVTELLPIYEELADGSELMYKELNSTKLKNIKKRVRPKDSFNQ